MRILLDCDVLLDVLLARLPHADDSGALLDWAESHPGQCAVAWHTVSNLEYLCEGGIREFVRELLVFAEIPRTGGQEMGFALAVNLRDFEDAMQVAAAQKFGAQIIATRNVKDYRKSPIKAMTPGAILPLLN